MLDRIYWGKDSRKLSKILPKREFVNCIITSPPYFNLKDYGHAKQIGFHDKTIEDYLDDIENVFKQCLAVLKDDGTLWLVSDVLKSNGRLIPLPFMIGERIEKVGWTLQDTIIWKKDKTLPFSFPGRFRNLFEYIHIYSKSRSFKFRTHRICSRHKDERRLTDLSGNEGRFLRGWPERYSPLGANPGDVWDIPIPVQGSWNPYREEGAIPKIHFCPFPQELVSRILSVASDPR